MPEASAVRRSESKLAELIDRYIDEHLPEKPRSEVKQKAQLTWWKNQIGAYTLADVTPALVAEHREKLAREKTRRAMKRNPATVNRYLAALSHAFTIAVREWGWVEDSPVRKVSRKKEASGRVRFLDTNERTRLLTACRESQNRFLYPLVVLALSTGARRGELLGLTWKDVDFERKVIVLHATKNDERRATPMVAHALAERRKLSKVRRIDTQMVFPGRRGDRPTEIDQAWRIALKRAQINDFRFHDLRHSAASYLAMSGASLAEIAEVLGHKTLQMVKRYAHLSDSHVSSVVERMNRKVFGAEWF
jgi:integrase